MEKLIVMLLIGIFGCLTATWLGGCAARLSITPIQQEEFVQKTFTNQLFDWVFNKSEEKKS